MIRSVVGHLVSLTIALVFAIIVWGIATVEENPNREGYYPDSLPVEIANRPEDLVVYEKKVDKVQVKFRAPQASWDRLQTISFRGMVDLQGLDAGLHQVPIQVQATDPQVTITDVNPKEVGIRLERIKIRNLEVRSDVLDTVPLGYIAKSSVISPTVVAISGPAVLVDQVIDATADIFLRGAKATVEREVTVQIHDVQGNIVQGVVISPTTVFVQVPVEQRVGYKDVSIKTVLKGSVASGYWVSNIVVSPSTVTIAASPEVMVKLPGYIETVPIDIAGGTTEIAKRATLALPEGVSVLNNEGVMVQISVTPLMGGQTVRRKVTVQGLRRGATATLSPDSLEVILSGPVPNLQGLSAEDIQVTVDVANLPGGTHQVKPRISAIPGALRVQNTVPDVVQVTIVEPTPTPTLAPTSTPTSTPVPAPTSTSTSTSTPTSTPSAIPKTNPLPTITPISQ